MKQMSFFPESKKEKKSTKNMFFFILRSNGNKYLKKRTIFFSKDLLLLLKKKQFLIFSKSFFKIFFLDHVIKIIIEIRVTYKFPIPKNGHFFLGGGVKF